MRASAERPPRLGVQRVPRAAHVEHLTGGSGRPPTRSGSVRRGSACHVSGRGVAEPAATAPWRRRRAPARATRAGDVAGVVARVALVLVGRVVLLVDHDQPEVARPGRRPPSAGRPRSAPRRSAAAATRRSARPRRAPSAAAPPCRRSAPGSAPTVCGVSAISGTSTITPSPRSSAAARRAGRPRSCPSRSRRAAARRRRARSPRAPPPARRSARPAGRRADGQRRPPPRAAAIATSPRASSRRSAAQVAARRRAAAPRAARAGCSVSRSPSSGWSVRAAHSSVRAARAAGARARAPAPASSSTRRPSTARARPAPPGSESARTAVGVTSFSAGTSVASASPTTTPSSAWCPNGTRTIEPTPTGASGSVVERPG